MADTNHASGNGTTPPNDTEFTAGTNLGGDTQVEFAAADVPMDDEATLSGGAGAQAGAGDTTDAGTLGEKFKQGAQKLVGDAGDKARTYAEDGKTKGAEALAGLSSMINSAAGDVDDKLGEQYGQYARNAAEAVNGFSEKLRDADIDDIVDDVREFVTKSPAIAIGAAAAIGFVLVRLVRSGLDADASA